jgi:L-lysine 2,3-aminomutase
MTGILSSEAEIVDRPLPEHRYRAHHRGNVEREPHWSCIPSYYREGIKLLSLILPFRVNSYVLDHLIDWSRVPDDPIFRLVFPVPEMLGKEEYENFRKLALGASDFTPIQAEVNEIRKRLNPHPAGQLTHNSAYLNGRKLPGIQHKYRETVLFFPKAGQTCHAYCTFCFRWPQFVKMPIEKFEASDSDDLVLYLRDKKEVTDILITGGDPMTMSTSVIRRYLTPILDANLDHIGSIRIGTKALTYWPYRFLTDLDADGLLTLFEEIVRKGKHLAIMAHFNHPVELSTAAAQRAIQRVLSTGAVIRIQAPIVRHINDASRVWAELWTKAVRLGLVPYYMFVERDTGPREYFGMPLSRVLGIFQGAYQSVSGLARTVRGPVMSTFHGKVVVEGITDMLGRQVFVLQFVQARDLRLIKKPFFAEGSDSATWFDELIPALDNQKYFFVS